MEIRPAIGQRECERTATRGLRSAFHVRGLFGPGELKLVFWENGRTVLGSAVLVSAMLKLEDGRELAAASAGSLASGVGRGSREATFASRDASQPAKFFLIRRRFRDGTAILSGRVA